MTRTPLPAAILVFSLASASASWAEGDRGLPLSGSDAERFLREAVIVSSKPIGVGITRPKKVTLSDGFRTHDAVWKTVDEIRRGLNRGRKGGYQLGTWDSYRYEVAAYELDKLLGLGIVPPTVEREIDGRRGSLQMWVEGGFTELDRRERSLTAPDIVRWSDRLGQLRLFQSLVYDSDYLNIRNILYDESFQVYSIDHSRAFRIYPVLLEEARLVRFSRALLARLEALTRDELDAALGGWLKAPEIDGILARRDKILARARSAAERLGDETVFYP